MEISDRIKQKRKYLGLSKRELAEKIGVHETSIGKYEQGKVDFPVSKIKKLAKVLGVSEVWLLGLDKSDKDTLEIEGLIDSLQKALNTPEDVTFKGEPIGEYYKCYFYEVLNTLKQLIVDRQKFIKMLEKMNHIDPAYQIVESDPKYQHEQAKKDVEELFRKTFEDRIL